MNHLQLAFIIGLLGSLHCVGMCGPLAFALTKHHESRTKMVFQKLSYNLGRTASYTFLGLIMGLVGKQLWIAGLQQWISILSGVLIIVATLPRVFPALNRQNFRPNFIINDLQHLIAKAINRKAGHFYVGMLNGLLPCGFVYLGLASAINSSSVAQSALFMLFFGLGTTPLMLAAMVGFNFTKPKIRYQINRALPVLTIFLGLWFVLRGLNLDIPYLSPLIGETRVICH
ncbi:sulfite exporter TauE/SafE family protein [Pelobium sp.]|nr:sulfite exporter TauE/SafE family protein [Pelobium sp.]MDA9555450.1 sulfite exporter TauE/SafE family protein [Pelobium sp.]